MLAFLLITHPWMEGLCQRVNTMIVSPWLPVEGMELSTESVLHNKAKVNTRQKAN